MKKAKTVLIVDDNEEILVLARIALRRGGYDTLTAISGKLGIELAKKHKPDLILLDIMMPEQDGLTTLNQLKSKRSLRKIPVFMLTAKNKIEDMEEALALDAEDYITKPFDADSLRDSVTRKYNHFISNLK